MSGHGREWRRAILFSVALHLLAVAGLYWLGSRAGGAGTPMLVLETCVADGPAVSVLLLDEAPVVRRPTPPAPPIVQVAATMPEPAPAATFPREHAAPVEPPTPGMAGAAPAQATVARAVAWELPAGSGGASFFAISAPRAQRVVYVIDCSASMGQYGFLARAHQELLASLVALAPNTAFQIVPYNRSAEPLRIAGQTGLVPATPENKQLAASLLQQLRAEGSTNHEQALRRALELQPEVVFFLTDASDMKPEQIRRIVQINQGRAVIHCIELRRSPRGPDSPLLQLARTNRGVYQPVAP